jgi:hypothetical protein
MHPIHLAQSATSVIRQSGQAFELSHLVTSLLLNSVSMEQPVSCQSKGETTIDTLSSSKSE